MSTDFELQQTVLPAHWRPPGTCAQPSDAAIRDALELMLGSEEFRKAQRMRRLLRFLVERRLAGAVRDTTEYAVGIDVFDRDPTTYSTCDDPIVRVQVGRLRGRLQMYYAQAGRRSRIRFTIPVGSYMPSVDLIEPATPGVASASLLAVAPLGVFTNQAEGVEFARGLNDELTHRLFEAFGRAVMSHTADHQASGATHRLECGLRVNGPRMRLSVRLQDSASGCVVWGIQLDEPTAYAIAVQESLALAVCHALLSYFDRGQPVT